MKHSYVVERMSKKEIELALTWATQEGWNMGLHDAECFYQTDPRGFFAGKLNDNLIAIGSAVIYDEEFAFCGLYIVDQAYRGQGYGLELTQQRLAYIGQRNAGIDGVLTMLDKYERLGYKTAHQNARYRGADFFYERKAEALESIVPLSQINFEQLLQYDRLHFPARRALFLNCWIKQPGGKSVGYLVDDHLCGYGVIRPCQQGFKIGPLFANTPKIAEELFLTLANHAQGQSFYLDIPENNPLANELVNKYQLKKIFSTARMYLKGQPKLKIGQIYGITTFELG